MLGVAAALAASGVLLGIGGALHPHSHEDTLTGSLLVMLDDPGWGSAHTAILVGLLVGLGGLVLAARSGVLGARTRTWTWLAAGAWALAAAETVPHLLAGGEHDALASGGPTPMVDAHEMLSLVTSPLLGLSSAALALAVALSARSVPAWALAVPGVVGGLLFAAAAPLLAVTGDPAMSALFSALALVSLWLVGTSLRLVLRGRGRATTG